MADTQALETLLDYLKQNRGFDFTGYKRSTLERRIAHRMEEVGVEGWSDYIDYLEVHPAEFVSLFNTILINVTGFFRDRPAWDALTEDIIPRLLAARGDDQPIRIWCAGCSSGEETYSLAVAFAGVMGEQAYQRRVKIYATDVDEDALGLARHATYTAEQIADVSPEVLEGYFERVDQSHAFRSDLRRTVIFGRNDLVQDAPISRIDLLVCRNTLMYFNAEAQGRILRRFHFALNDDGFLFMGRSEMLITHSDLFVPVDFKQRIFAKVVRPARRERLPRAEQNNGADGMLDGGEALFLRESAFEASPVAQIVTDRHGVLVMANSEARTLLRLARADIGRPLKDLEVSPRPVELEAHLDRALKDKQSAVLEGVAVPSPDGDQRLIDVRVTPLVSGNSALAISVTYMDVTGHRELQEELERSRAELENAYEELQSMVEELETTNEELQSTNEELETTNEELQASNEELETMNEELQATNEEHVAVNAELRRRSRELDEVNLFLETILTSLEVAVVVLDAAQQVTLWNLRASELWGVRSEEARGRHFLGLDIGLPMEPLKQLILGALDGGSDREEITLQAINRRGKAIGCRVTVLPMRAQGAQAAGAILLMEEGPSEGASPA